MTQGIKEKDIRDFEKAAEKLSAVVERIRKYKPEAIAFLDNGDTFQLISDGDKYDEYCAKGKYQKALELVVTNAYVNGFGCGAIT